MSQHKLARGRVQCEAVGALSQRHYQHGGGGSREHILPLSVYSLSAALPLLHLHQDPHEILDVDIDILDVYIDSS